MSFRMRIERDMKSIEQGLVRGWNMHGFDQGLELVIKWMN